MDNNQIKSILNLIIEPDLIINSISLKKIKSLTNNGIQTVKDILDKDEEYKIILQLDLLRNLNKYVKNHFQCQQKVKTIT